MLKFSTYRNRPIPKCRFKTQKYPLIMANDELKLFAELP